MNTNWPVKCAPCPSAGVGVLLLHWAELVIGTWTCHGVWPNLALSPDIWRYQRQGICQLYNLVLTLWWRSLCEDCCGHQSVPQCWLSSVWPGSRWWRWWWWWTAADGSPAPWIFFNFPYWATRKLMYSLMSWLGQRRKEEILTALNHFVIYWEVTENI